MNVVTKQSLFLVLVALFLLPTSAEAVPGFARQMGVDCSSCHAQNVPKLNRFGREFARSGFTMSSYTGPQTMIEGSDIGLGLPSVLNASGILRASYTLSDGNETTGTDRGEMKVFDQSMLIFGGKFADNVGGLIGVSPIGFAAKGTVSYDALGGYTGFTIYSSASGAFTGMENYNTGLYSALRMFNNAKSTNAAQATGVGSGAATGLQAFYGGAGLFASIGIYAPAQNSDGLDVGASLIPFGRLAYEIGLGSWTVTPGAYAINGSAKMSDTALDDAIATPAQLVTIEREAYGVDLQLEGNIANMSTMVTVNAVLKNKTTLDPSTIKNIGNLKAEDETATSLELQVNPISSLGIKAAFLTYDTEIVPGKENRQDIDKNAYSAGINYGFRQNILLDVEYSYTDPKDTLIDPFSSLFFMATAAF